MNKTSMTLLVCILCVVSFFIGHKVGDSKGYADGYNEGYRYDCKEEIAAIYKQVKAQNQFIESVQTYARNAAVENDYLKNASRYKKNREIVVEELKRADSLRKKYEADSVKYHELAVKYDDSLAILTGYRGIIRGDGSADSVICALWSKDIGHLPECQPGWHISRVVKSKKTKRKK